MARAKGKSLAVRVRDLAQVHSVPESVLMSHFFFGPRFSIYKMEVLPLVPQGYWDVLSSGNGLRSHQRMFWLEDLSLNFSVWLLSSMAVKDVKNRLGSQSQLL